LSSREGAATMIEKHLQEIEIVSTSLESLKALIGLSQIEDDDWEGIACVLKEYSFRLRSAVDEIRFNLQNIEPDCHISKESDVVKIRKI
jgi:hypothetical protein